MIKKIVATIFLVFSIYSNSFSQIEASIGGYVGGGIISANSPNEETFASSVFIESYLDPADYISTRLSFIYATDFNSIIPESRNQYYPSIKAFSLKGIYTVYLNYNFYFEQGLGFITINDRIYSDRNNWDYGITASLLVGTDLRQNTINGFKLGLGMEYGLTFYNYSIQYFSVHFQAQFTF